MKRIIKREAAERRERKEKKIKVKRDENWAWKRSPKDFTKYHKMNSSVGWWLNAAKCTTEQVKIDAVYRQYSKKTFIPIIVKFLFIFL